MVSTEFQPIPAVVILVAVVSRQQELLRMSKASFDYLSDMFEAFMFDLTGVRF